MPNSNPNLSAAYREMSLNTEREAEALEWIEGTLLDPDEPSPNIPVDNAPSVG